MKKLLWALISSLIIGLLALAIIFSGVIQAWWKEIPEKKISKQQVPSGIQAEQIIPPQNDTGIDLNLPEGFSLSFFAQNLGAPRVLIQDPNGVLIASLTRNGKVVAMPDRNKDQKADEVIPLLEKLKNPHGLAFRCKDICHLYVAETEQLNRYDYDPEALTVSNKTKLIDLPKSGRHFTRTLLYLPDEDKLLVSIGSNCDVCHESDERLAKIFSMKPDGSEFKEYAKGLRNAVFMSLHPKKSQVWATEMGRDWLGDNLPPDEINIVQEGKNYGWPICYGKNIHDTNFDKNTYIRNPCMEPLEVPSHIDLQAHSAPLGLAFFTDSWPEEYRDDLLVAYHGSWNSTVPTGYKIVRFKLDENGNLEGNQQDFLSGWIKGTEVTGRPADILITEKNIFVSDDHSGNIYLIKYLEQK